MIGYYVHHHGHGHLQRARAVAEAWSAAGPAVTGLSTLPRPAGWRGPWVQLPPDDRATVPTDVTAGEQLHWVPLDDPGVQARAAALSRWLDRARPRAVVVDVSVETALLVRLHGVPVVSVVLPGRRTDPAHLLGFRLSSALVAFCPEPSEAAPADLTPGLPTDVRDRVVHVGAISRLATGGRRPLRDRAPRARHAVLLQGRGGDALWRGPVHALEHRTPGWTWDVLGGDAPWLDDPSEAIAAADVVVTTAGESSLADVAALRRPAVVVPTPRPYEEQHVTGSFLEAGPWPVVVVADTDDALSGSVLDRAVNLDGGAWRTWCDGSGTERLRAVVESIAGHGAEDQGKAIA